MDFICDNEQRKALNRQLIISISEILAEQKLLSEEEKNRVIGIVNNNM